MKAEVNSPRLVGVVACATIFLLVVAVYAPSLRNSFIYDDQKLILQQPVPGSLGDMLSVFTQRHWPDLPYYRPVVRFTFVLQKRLSGDDPRPYHLFNILAGGAAALAAYQLLRTPSLGIRPAAAWIAAGLFALHPIASCTVYPICSGRETLLPTLFCIAAAASFIRPGFFGHALALVFFALGLFSKEQAIVLPGIFVLSDCLGVSANAPGRSWTKWVSRYWAVAAIGVFYLLVRWLLFGGAGEHRLAVGDQPQGPLVSILYVLQTALVPFVDLVYEPPVAVWLSWPRQLVVAVLLATAGFVIYCDRSVSRRMMFWAGWWLLALLPTANIFVQQAPFAERYGLLALLGLLGGAATLATALWERKRYAAIVAVGMALLVICGAISMHRCQYFANNFAFYKQWVKSNPNSVQARMSLGEELYEARRLEDAAEHFERVVESEDATGFERSFAHYALGQTSASQGAPQTAVSHFRQAIRLRPRFAEAHNGLGLALANLNSLTQAQAQLETAIRIHPEFAVAHNNLGMVLARQGRLAAAISHFHEATRLEPMYVDAYVNLGNAYAVGGDFSTAVDCFERALNLQPQNKRIEQFLLRAQELMRQQKSL